MPSPLQDLPARDGQTVPSRCCPACSLSEAVGSCACACDKLTGGRTLNGTLEESLEEARHARRKAVDTNSRDKRQTLNFDSWLAEKKAMGPKLEPGYARVKRNARRRHEPGLGAAVNASRRVGKRVVSSDYSFPLPALTCQRALKLTRSKFAIPSFRDRWSGSESPPAIRPNSASSMTRMAAAAAALALRLLRSNV